MADDKRWYPLDGTWHQSVAARMSALHLQSPDPHTRGSAACNPMATALLMDDGYTEEEAAASGRTLCKRCKRSNDIHHEGK